MLRIRQEDPRDQRQEGGEPWQNYVGQRTVTWPGVTKAECQAKGDAGERTETPTAPQEQRRLDKGGDWGD